MTRKMALRQARLNLRRKQKEVDAHSMALWRDSEVGRLWGRTLSSPVQIRLPKDYASFYASAPLDLPPKSP